MSALLKHVLSLTGLNRRIQQAKIAAGEGALAAEDRAQLLRFAWEEEKARLRGVLLLVGAAIGLTIVAMALLSVAVVVHYWDTPQRTTFAWIVAALWVIVWLATVVALLSKLRNKSESVAAVQQAFERDWHWVQAQIGSRPANRALRAPRPVTREELLARIERQRERIETLQHPPAGSGAARPAADLGAEVGDLVRSHPVIAAATVAAVVAVVRPRRLVRLATWLAPIVWRMRQ